MERKRTRKAHSFPPEGCGKKGDREEKTRSGHNVLFPPLLGTDHQLVQWLQNYPDCAWKNQEYWAVGTQAWGHQRDITTLSKDNFAATLNTE